MIREGNHNPDYGQGEDSNLRHHGYEPCKLAAASPYQLFLISFLSPEKFPTVAVVVYPQADKAEDAGNNQKPEKHDHFPGSFSGFFFPGAFSS